MAMTGEAVQQMEADLHAAMIRIAALERSNALLDMENSHLRQQNSTMRTERDDAMIQCAEMRTIMEQVSSGLVSGLGRMGFTKRQRQERALGVGAEEDRPPGFLTAKPSSEGDRFIGQPIDHAAAIAPKVLRPQTIDKNLADNDSRMPKLDYPPGDADAASLRLMHDTIGQRQAR